MKDSINRKAQQRERSTCDRLNKRHSELFGRGEVQISSSEIHAKSECEKQCFTALVRYYRYAQKYGFLQHFYSASTGTNWSRRSISTEEALVCTSQPIGLTVEKPVCESRSVDESRQANRHPCR